MVDIQPGRRQVLVQVGMLPEEHERLKRFAAATGQSVSLIARRACAAYMDALEPDVSAFAEKAVNPSLNIKQAKASVPARGRPPKKKQ